jgi:hypothetical protein
MQMHRRCGRRWLDQSGYLRFIGCWLERPYLLSMVGCALTLLLGVDQMPANAQCNELVTPAPQTWLRDAKPAEAQRLEQIQARPGTTSVDVVTIDADALRDATTRVTISNTTTFILSGKMSETRPNNSFTWTGTTSDTPGVATMVVHNGNVTGTISHGADLYRIEPRPGEGWRASRTPGPLNNRRPRVPQIHPGWVPSAP